MPPKRKKEEEKKKEEKKKKPKTNDIKKGEEEVITCIQMSLQKLMPGGRKIHLPKIEELVKRMHVIHTHASLLFNAYLRRLLEGADLKFPDITMNGLSEFYYAVTKGKRKRKKENLDIRTVFEKEMLPFMKDQMESREGIDGNLIREKAGEMATAFKNNLQTHYWKRFYKILTIECDGDKKKAQRIFNEIRSGKTEHCFFLKKKKDNLEELFYLTAKIQKELKKKEKKLCAVIPLTTSNVPGCIALDTTSLYMWFYKECAANGWKKDALKENRNEIWNKFFKIKKKKNFNFHFRLVTNGVKCSIMYSRVQVKQEVPEKTEEEIRREVIRERRIPVGVDPGKYNILYMVSKEGGKRKELRYSNVQRRFEGFGKTAQKLLEKRKKKNPQIIQIEKELSNYNSKDISVDVFKKYLKKKLEHLKELFDFYSHLWFRKQRWERVKSIQSSEDCFFNQIEKTFGKKEKILLCYGLWNRKQQIKGK